LDGVDKHHLLIPERIANMATLTTTIKNDLTNCDCMPANGNTRIEVYVDGSCLGNPGPGGWGFVALLINEVGPILDKVERYGAAKAMTTNNRAEMAGALNALAFVTEQQALGLWPICPVRIVSDSQYVVKGFTEWLPNWEARGWRKSDRKPVENRDLWERLKGATLGLSVEWHWVKGHEGNSWNERADQLAATAADEAAALGVTFREAVL
jgi:ribonuclease HI